MADEQEAGEPGPVMWEGVDVLRHSPAGQITIEHHPLADQIAALPRYTHALLGQSQVASRMVAAEDGEWIRREDVLKLL